VIIGYKVEYAWWKYPHDKLAIHKKYFKRKLHARAFFLRKIKRDHYYCARIVPILKEG